MWDGSAGWSGRVDLVCWVIGLVGWVSECSTLRLRSLGIWEMDGLHLSRWSTSGKGACAASQFAIS